MLQKMFPVHNRIGAITKPMTKESPLEIGWKNEEIAGLQPDEVLVKVRASAICGSDLHIARGLHPSVKDYPCTIGHEFAGDVVAIGSGVTSVHLGERVTVEPCIVCGKCDACRHGDYGYCEHITYTYRIGHGAMANYVVVKEPYVYELPQYLNYQTGALMEPLSVATHAVRRANIGLGERVLIIGAGAIGMMVAAMCHAAGAGQVIIADFSENRLETAKQIGADVAICSAKLPIKKDKNGNQIVDDDDGLVQEVRRLTGGKGVDKAFEAVGKQSCMEQALHSLVHNGLLTIIGIYEKPITNFNSSIMITRELRVQGAQGYCWDFPVAIAAAKNIPLEKFITHTFSLDQFEEALNTALDRNSKSIKVEILEDGENGEE